MSAPRPKRPRDTNQLGRLMVDILTGEVEDRAPKAVNEAQRRGGLAGGKSRAASMSPERRSEVARAAAEKRWRKHDA